MDYNGVEITGYTGSDMKVRIPETIEGEKVTYINCKFPNTITQIEFPDTVTNITMLPESIKYFNIPMGLVSINNKESLELPNLISIKAQEQVFEFPDNKWIQCRQSILFYYLG